MVYPDRCYCTQYDGTDLHFIHRLCEEECIHYHLEHNEPSHVLVFGDGQTNVPSLSQPTSYYRKAAWSPTSW